MIDRVVSLLQRVSGGYENYVRFTAMRLVLAPVAHYSLAAGIRCANVIAGFLVATTAEGAKIRGQMATAFGTDARQSARLARGWFARQLRDFVYLRRLLTGRETVRSDAVIHTGSAEAHRLVSQPGPLILATGHFAREAVIALVSPGVTPGPLGQLTNPLPKRSVRPYPLRIALQFGTFLKTQAALRGSAGTFIYVGADGLAGSELFRFLVKGRAKVTMAVDAPWTRGQPSTHERSFAGRANAAFSVGPARLSRLSQAPVVLAIPYADDAGRTVIEWLGPFPPPARDAVAGEAVLLDVLLDHIEHAVGARPTQYVLQIGGSRRWSAAARQWSPA